jgi:thiol-disulfide isomerase/thioredoxin
MKQLIFLGVLIGFASASAQKLPEFRLTSTTGDIIDSKLLEGKSVYINIWETYCAPCIHEIHEIPVLNELKEKFPQITFLSITPASKASTARFVKKYPFDFPVIYEARKLVDKLKQGGYPTDIFIYASGNITSLAGGAGIGEEGKQKLSEEEITSRIRKMNYERLDNALIVYCKAQ